MRIDKLRKLLLLIIVGMHSLHAYSETIKSFNSEVMTYETILGATRLVYLHSSKGVSLSISNPKDYPILIQSRVLDEGKNNSNDFIVTPPLFRLNGNENNRITIVHTSSEWLIKDKETLNWVCVKSIPPKNDDTWAKNTNKNSEVKSTDVNIQIALNNCIKLISRPDEIKDSLVEHAGELTWTFEDNNFVKANNPTAYYMNLSSLTVGGKTIDKAEYIPPFSSKNYILPTGVSHPRTVSWQIIDDFGGQSEIFRKNIQ